MSISLAKVIGYEREKVYRISSIKGSYKRERIKQYKGDFIKVKYEQYRKKRFNKVKNKHCIREDRKEIIVIENGDKILMRVVI